MEITEERKRFFGEQVDKLHDMEDYTIAVTEVLQRCVNVRAKSYEKAFEKVSKMYNNQEIVLDADDLVECRLEEVRDI